MELNLRSAIRLLGVVLNYCNSLRFMFAYRKLNFALIPVLTRGGARGSVVGRGTISRNVSGSIPDKVTEFLNLPNPSSRNIGPEVHSASNRNEYQEPSWG
jgi:hypothetical protein